MTDKSNNDTYDYEFQTISWKVAAEKCHLALYKLVWLIVNHLNFRYKLELEMTKKTVIDTTKKPAKDSDEESKDELPEGEEEADQLNAILWNGKTFAELKADTIQLLEETE